MTASNENDQPNLMIVPAPSTASDQASTGVDLIDEPALANRLGVSRSTLQSWRYREPLVELLQRQDSAPGPSRKLLVLQALQLAAVGSGQLQSRRTCRLGLHPNA